MVEEFCRRILARGPDGEEHQLQVVRDATGLIVIRDEEMMRVLAPAAALELGSQLLRYGRLSDGPAQDWAALIERLVSDESLSEEDAGGIRALAKGD